MLNVHLPRWMIAALAVAGMTMLAGAAGCQAGAAGAEQHVPAVKPAKVEVVPGSPVKRVVLTADAAKRLDVQTTAIREMPIAGQPRKVVPYSAVIYDRKGEPWVITNPEPLTYIRQRIVVQYISQDMAVLADGPPNGTQVVSTGAAEVYGTELGVG
jgi:hypothetical protein